MVLQQYEPKQPLKPNWHAAFCASAPNWQHAPVAPQNEGHAPACPQSAMHGSSRFGVDGSGGIDGAGGSGGTDGGGADGGISGGVGGDGESGGCPGGGPGGGGVIGGAGGDGGGEPATGVQQCASGQPPKPKRHSCSPKSYPKRQHAPSPQYAQLPGWFPHSDKHGWLMLGTGGGGEGAGEGGSDGGVGGDGGDGPPGGTGGDVGGVGSGSTGGGAAGGGEDTPTMMNCSHCQLSGRLALPCVPLRRSVVPSGMSTKR